MVVQRVVAEFDRYVLNDIPIRLVYIPEMKIVDRDFVRSYYQQTIQSITEQEADIWGWLVTALVQTKVRYAILSHRWGAKEPTYLDLSTTLHQLEHDQGPGYRKLKRFCLEARARGIVFAWSDTCCIDKSSSAELDESIRSMFRWYRNADVCLVHLAQTRGAHELHRDVWFGRGWTLQELLAPRVIKFFDAGWGAVTREENDKGVNGSLLEALQRATGIHEQDLRAFAPDPYDVDKRMTWAAKRVTTRVEDAAYSLMGMFDVSIQIAYGEGADRAFARLVEAIMLAGGSPTVLNWAGQAAVHHASTALPKSPASYVGHRELKVVSKPRLNMALTSRGLRLPLLILHVSFRATPDESGYIKRLTLKCDRGPIQAEVEVQLSEERVMLGVRFALGVFSYGLVEEGANPSLPAESTAYLLVRNAEDEDERSRYQRNYTGWTTKDMVVDWYVGEQWRRVSTDFITFKIWGAPEDHPDPSIYLSNQFIEDVYL